MVDMIEVHRKPSELVCQFLGQERCCICRENTDHGYAPKDVACCRRFAHFANHSDIPTKKDWCRKEDTCQSGAEAWGYPERSSKGN